MRQRIFTLAVLVCALSVSVSGQGVRIRHRVLTATVVQNPPNTPNSPSPADGTTINTINPTLTCLATGDAQGGALSYTISFGTNTPPTNIVNGTSLGAACSYVTPTLGYETTYYWRITATNTNGPTVGAIWSFSTEPDPTPPVDPDPTCLSTTASPTGHQPMSWTSCRQDTWDHMEADFLAVCPSVAQAAGACAATPATLGGQIFKDIREVALGIKAGCTGGVCYGDEGQYNAWMYQVTGDSGWVARGYTLASAFFDVNVDAKPYQAAPYQAYHVIGQDLVRENAIRLVRVADWLEPGLTAPQKTRLLDGNAQFLAGIIHGAQAAFIGSDSDQIVGEYFGLVMHYLANPTYQPAIDNFNYATTGGLTPTLTAANYVPGVVGSTRRNAVQWYFDLATGGEWIESAEYNMHTVMLFWEGADAVKTMTGIDYFPEITAWNQDAALHAQLMMLPDLTQNEQWGDEENPRTLRKFHIAGHMMTLAGVLQGTTPGRRVFGLYNDMVGKYGLASMLVLPNIGMPYIFFNPYDTAAEWRTTLSYTAAGQRIALRKSHISDTTASQFQSFYGGSSKLNTTQNRTIDIQHQGTQFGDWELWRNGNWAITHPKDYAGPSVYAGDGNNSPIMFGYSAMKNYNGAWAALNASEYTYVTGTTGGSQHPYQAYRPPPPYCNEWTREQIYVPGTTDTVIIFDRANIISPFPDLSPSGYAAPILTNLHRWDALHSKIIVQHMDTSPTLVGSAFTWTTRGGEAAKHTVVYPTSFASTTYNEASNPGGWTLWNNVVLASERKYHVKIYPADNVLFNTFLTVTQVGTAGTVTAIEDSGKAQCAHMTRPAQGDVLACFNSEAGASLTPTPYHTGISAALSVVRYRETGFTITWTASSAASTLVLLQDLNPANSWTIAVDGGAPSALNGTLLTTNKGHYTATITGAGSHTIVLVGT